MRKFDREPCAPIKSTKARSIGRILFGFCRFAIPTFLVVGPAFVVILSVSDIAFTIKHWHHWIDIVQRPIDWILGIVQHFNVVIPGPILSLFTVSLFGILVGYLKLSFSIREKSNYPLAWSFFSIISVVSVVGTFSVYLAAVSTPWLSEAMVQTIPQYDRLFLDAFLMSVLGALLLHFPDKVEGVLIFIANARGRG